MPATAERPQAVGRRLDYHFPLWPKQQYAFESPATEILFGGAAGPGKSHLLRVAMIQWCFEISGLQCYLFRRLHDDLIKNHMEGDGSFVDLLADAVNDQLVTITQRRVAFYNGSRIFLNHLQYDKHLRKYQGTAFHVLAIDELTHFQEHQYRYLRGRVRMTKEMQARLPKRYYLGERDGEKEYSFPRIITGSNPGSEGHVWVKKTFVTPGKFTIYRQPDDEGGGLRQFIPALMKDNPSLNRVEYERKLAGLGDPVLVRALKEGDWSIAEGAMFGETWRATQYGIDWHVHPGFEIPNWWPLWRGADDGYSDPFAGYWGTRDPKYGTLYVIDELYKTKMLPEEVARRVKERDMQIPLIELSGKEWVSAGFNRTALRGAIDSSAFTDPGESDKKGEKVITRGDQMNKHGCKWDSVQKWPGSRVAGIQNFHRLLAPNEKAPLLYNARGEVLMDQEGRALHDRPGIVFFRRCVNAIEHIPALPRSKQELEDIGDVDFDHSFDGVRYFVQYNRGETKRVKVSGI